MLHAILFLGKLNAISNAIIWHNFQLSFIFQKHFPTTILQPPFTTSIHLYINQQFPMFIEAIRMLAYDMSDNVVDEHVKLGKSTTIESLKRFCLAIIGCYEL